MTTFNYSSKSVLKDNLTTIGLSLLLVVVPIVYPFGLKIGSTRILGPLPTAIILIALGLFILFKVLMKIRKARALAAKGCIITVNEDRVTYPIIKKGAVQQGAFRISEISDVSYNEEDGILTVTLTNGTKAEFDLDFFESLSKLKEFVALIQK